MRQHEFKKSPKIPPTTNFHQSCPHFTQNGSTYKLPLHNKLFCNKQTHKHTHKVIYHYAVTCNMLGFTALQ